MPRGKKKKIDTKKDYEFNTKDCIKEAVLDILKVSTFILMILGMMFFAYIPLFIFKLDLNSFSNLQRILYNFACDFGFMIIVFLIFRKMLIEKFKEYFKNFRENFELGFKYYFIGFIIMIVVNLILALFVKGATANNEEMVRQYIDSYPLYMIFSVSLYAPFIEEMTFRFGIKNSLRFLGDGKLSRVLYVVLSGLVFGLMHIVLTNPTPLDYLYVIPYMALGCSFAALYQRTDNIFSSMIFHCLHNTVAIVLLLIGSGI